MSDTKKADAPKFDPFTASLDEALAQPDAHGARGAVWQWAGAQDLRARQAFYEIHPLDGVATCLIHGLVAPEWLAKAYMRGFRRVLACEVRSWDEAFGAAFPKGVNLAARRRAREHRAAAANVFADMVKRDPFRPIDPGFWDELGRRIGEGKTRAEELYREALHIGVAQTADDLRTAHRRTIPAKTRKLAGIHRRR